MHSAASVPVFMNSMNNSAAAARGVACGELDIRGCRSCGFVWNAAFDGTKIEYDENYENNQCCSTLFFDHLSDRARDIVSAIDDDHPIDYLEVGCGQGQFIDLVKTHAGSRLRSAVGFDPAWRGDHAVSGGSSKIVKSYFGPDTVGHLDVMPNVVVSRHTIEHVPDPVAFLSSIRGALGDLEKATIFVETPRVEWIFDNVALHDFFYEHCSLFSEEAMREALLRSGFDGVEILPVFGDQYLWARAEFGASGESDLSASKHHDRRWLRPLRDDFNAFIERWREKIRVARDRGPSAIWGAGAKGVSFALLVDPEGAYFDYVIDINPIKQDHFMPGTGLEILSPERAAGLKPKTIFVMNPNYLGEIKATIDELEIDAKLEPVN